MNSGVRRLARIKALTENPVRPGQRRGLSPLGGRLMFLGGGSATDGAGYPEKGILIIR